MYGDKELKRFGNTREHAMVAKVITEGTILLPSFKGDEFTCNCEFMNWSQVSEQKLPEIMVMTQCHHIDSSAQKSPQKSSILSDISTYNIKSNLGASSLRMAEGVENQSTIRYNSEALQR
jgi:hypothetical protein